ncbi:putative nicotinamide mononucleotide transmembrane transporter protein [Thermochaetoides thermophila DSM 1495]|uniref:Putative nicotinamide mononucleotide transmembrane transporter protein n=1 Tax=Chaetomium thermophilum (strain DSM 1495 / CBS 144.50 / IMI 039719) TaxID=759272 RepID=G0SFI2_CHATD|nr:putative nicotinamide mononucleotide transmembrane transporter protein [Thermochaetoides thermophila DSM 1495]EGS17747.1 putative nicotinamide mononucleotide transmembrane transporter protein [Thermochaetoides thermophila DSM 1495]
MSIRSEREKHSSDEESPSPSPPSLPILPPNTSDRLLTLRIDTHILPFVITLYLLAFLDRVNIANARAFGLESDLHMTGRYDYNTALTIFFIPYILFEVPSNILLKKLSPRVWLSACCIGFGVVTVCQGFCRNFGGLLAARFFLGKWLSPSELSYLQAKLALDQGPSAAEKRITPRDVLRVLTDYKVWLGGLMYLGLIVPAYSYAFFAPTIIQAYNSSSAIETQLRSVPPWACAFGLAMIVAIASDKARHRFAFTVTPILLSVAGFGVLFSVFDKLDVQYAALFLICMGTYAAMPVIVCWFNMNLGGHHRRAVGSAWQVAFGNIGGIISTYSFLKEDAPRFTKGYAICVGFISLSVVSCVAYELAVAWENRKKEKILREGELNLTEEEKTALGDLSPEFKYML